MGWEALMAGYQLPGCTGVPHAPRASLHLCAWPALLSPCARPVSTFSG